MQNNVDSYITQKVRTYISTLEVQITYITLKYTLYPVLETDITDFILR